MNTLILMAAGLSQRLLPVNRLLQLRHYLRSTVFNRLRLYSSSCTHREGDATRLTASADISSDRKRLTVQYWSVSDEIRRREETGYHAVWLRHHCQCPQCTASTGQRTVPLDILGGDIRLVNATAENGRLSIQWSTNGTVSHSGYVSLDWLRDNDYSKTALEQRNAAMEPTVASSIPAVEYEEIMNSSDGLWEWLNHLNCSGICLITNAPFTDELLCKKVGEKISYIQKQMYGEVYDIKIEPNPINIAYTADGLEYHIDLVYYQSPPGLQLLHCIRNDACVEGGVTFALDAIAVVNEIRKNHPEEFLTLTSVPATFQKIHFDRDHPVAMVRRQPHIVLDRTGRVVRVNWSPTVEGPLQVNESEIDKYYQAYCVFQKTIDNSSHRLEHRLIPGDILTFNNLRILHGRTAITLNGGIRHFVGCMINIDEFYSRFNVLSRELGKKGVVTKHVLNGSSYF